MHQLRCLIWFVDTVARYRLANAEAMRESPGSAKRGRKAIDKSGYLAVQEGGCVANAVWWAVL